MSELAIVDDTQESVIDLHLKGLNPTLISKQTGIQRKEVIKLISHWREAVRNDNESRDTARDSLNKMVEHYDRLISKFYDLVKEIDESMNGTPTHQWIGQKNSALKSIAELEAKRVDALQKAGIMDNNDLGDELAKMEEQKQLILGILKDDLCPHCRPKVMQKIGEMTGRVEVVVVHDD